MTSRTGPFGGDPAGTDGPGDAVTERAELPGQSTPCRRPGRSTPPLPGPPPPAVMAVCQSLSPRQPLLLPLLLLPLLLLAAGAAAQKIRIGPCPDIGPVTDFNLTAYSGLWYENRKLQAIFQLGQKCVTARYSDDLGGFISVTNTGYLFNHPITIYGYAVPTNETTVGALAVGFPEAPDTDQANYNVIEVDYQRYAVVYSCTPQVGNLTHKEFLWLLTRQPKFPEPEAKQIVRRLMQRGIFQAYEMQRTVQFLCPGRDDLPDFEF